MLKTKLAIVDHKRIERIAIEVDSSIFKQSFNNYVIVAYLRKHPLEQEQLEVKLDNFESELDAAEELSKIFDEYTRLQKTNENS
ncbi:hypothetical protein [Erysipelothrix anatis]|uniref:hypothetical protein n=1 Tax=Erysipelothrix anatis TaxID=2683713 RepID=UPI00135A8183|nr:hypothetical protein [Erysipelothrix anatis]